MWIAGIATTPLEKDSLPHMGNWDGDYIIYHSSQDTVVHMPEVILLLKI